MSGTLSLSLPAVVLVAVTLLVGCHGIDDTEEFRRERTRTNLELMSSSLNQFKQRTGNYPDAVRGLQALTDPGQPGGAIVRAVPKDGWGRPLVYGVVHDNDSESFVLYSMGPN